jgi:histidine triad (HIT) family protein
MSPEADRVLTAGERHMIEGYLEEKYGKGRPKKNCAFCRIITGDDPVTLVRSMDNSIAIVPLRPVVQGHLIFIARRHVSDFIVSSVETSLVMADVATHAAIVGGSYNLITSAGRPATQTVFHLHVHLVPRRYGDGLALPWDPA